MFKAWKERRRLQELATACENERRKLTDPDPLAKHNAAVALAELGDDSGAHLLGAWLRGSRREEYRREIESRWRNPDPNVAAVSLGRLAALGSSKALQELEAAVGQFPARADFEQNGRAYAGRELKKLGHAPQTGSVNRRGWLHCQGHYELLAREHRGKETIESLAVEAQLGVMSAVWGLGYFPDALSVEKLAQLLTVNCAAKNTATRVNRRAAALRPPTPGHKNPDKALRHNQPRRPGADPSRRTMPRGSGWLPSDRPSSPAVLE